MAYTVEKILKIADGEVGYCEKKSNKSLESKTKNRGYNNYTKYNAVFGVNGCYWCCYYIMWLFYTLCNDSKSKAKELLFGTLSGACETIRQSAIKADRYDNKPRVGALVFFKGTRHAGANHIALVTKVTTTKIYTNEGNTSDSDGVNDNGGEVAEKAYSRNYSKILGYAHPYYEGALIEISKDESKKLDGRIDTIEEVQIWLNKNYNAKLSVDNEYGKNTKKALVKALQKELNETYKPKTKLVVDGVWGDKTKSCIKVLKKGDKNDVVKILQALLVCNGYPKAYVDGNFGAATVTAIKSYKKKKKFSAINMNGNAGKVLFESLCK